MADAPVPRRDVVPTVLVVVASLLVLGPVLLHRGYVLVGDMTFVPHQPWKAAWLGLDGAPPRAVPADAFVSALTQVVPGDLVQKAVLLAALVTGGSGVVRLLRGTSRVARTGGGLLFVWNPWVHERLAIGQWGLLLGLAALPWVVAAAADLRERRPGSTRRLWCWLALAAFSSPTGGVVAGVVAVVLAGSRRAWSRAVLAAAVALTLNLPWIVPGVLGGTGGSSRSGVTGFAAAADTPLGVLGSLATLGGIWKASVVPPERGAWVLAVLALLVSLVALLCLWASGPGSGAPRGGQHGRRLVVLGVVGLVLAWWPSTAAGAEVAQWLVVRVPGAALWRDSQKLVMPLVLAVAVGFGMALERGARLLRRDEALSWLVVPAAALPVLLLPSLAWAQLGQLHPVSYPAEWGQVAAQLQRAGAGHDRIVVLPWSAYVRYAWNGERAALDPAIRFFPGEVLTSGDLLLSGGRVVPGDDPRTRPVGTAVAARRPLDTVLDRLHVRWVLVEKGVPTSAPVLVPRGRTVHDGSQLLLLDRGRQPSTPPWTYAGVVVGVDIALGTATALVLGSLVGRGAVAARRRRRIG